MCLYGSQIYERMMEERLVFTELWSKALSTQQKEDQSQGDKYWMKCMALQGIWGRWWTNCKMTVLVNQRISHFYNQLLHSINRWIAASDFFPVWHCTADCCWCWEINHPDACQSPFNLFWKIRVALEALTLADKPGKVKRVYFALLLPRQTVWIFEGIILFAARRWC